MTRGEARWLVAFLGLVLWTFGLPSLVSLTHMRTSTYLECCYGVGVFIGASIVAWLALKD